MRRATPAAAPAADAADAAGAGVVVLDSAPLSPFPSAHSLAESVTKALSLDPLHWGRERDPVCQSVEREKGKQDAAATITGSRGSEVV